MHRSRTWIEREVRKLCLVRSQAKCSEWCRGWKWVTFGSVGRVLSFPQSSLSRKFPWTCLNIFSYFFLLEMSGIIFGRIVYILGNAILDSFGPFFPPRPLRNLWTARKVRKSSEYGNNSSFPPNKMASQFLQRCYNTGVKVCHWKCRMECAVTIAA